MKSLHVKKGDRVVVIAGKDKGAKGEIISVDPVAGRVVVQGVNLVKKHRKEQQNTQTRNNRTPGGIITAEAPIDVSNVQLLVRVGGKEVPTRVGYRRDEVTKRRADGTEYTASRSVRIARKTGKEI